jgi:hypothetical protein
LDIQAIKFFKGGARKMMLDVYICGLSSNEWGADRNFGKTPFTPGRGDLSPFFPSTFNRRHFGEVIDRIQNGRYEGRQVDWGSWEAVVTKKDILEFIADMYGERGKDYLARYDKECLSFKREQMYELLIYVDKLEDGKEYALVASEL